MTTGSRSLPARHSLEAGPLPRFPRAPRILVVDDEEINLEVIRRILEPAGYANLTCTADPRQAMTLFRERQPDLVLLDLRMPELDGLELLDLLVEEIPADEYLPILVLTSDGSVDAKRGALSGGAQDFLIKPLSPVEVRLRVQNLLQTRFLHLELQEQNRLLETRVAERTQALLARTTELEAARLEILERLARAAEFRDDDTGQHTQRVGRTAALVAQALGVEPGLIEVIRRSAPLHDVGKIGVPDRILLKEGRLDAAEFELMKGHTIIGGAILAGSSMPLLVVGREIALSHHERWDGQGYPTGAAGAAIPLSGRIVAVADVFDALTHGRPYKAAWALPDAVAEIARERGRQFDPTVVDAFLAVQGSGALHAAGEPGAAAC